MTNDEPWKEEPDRLFYIDNATDYGCHIERQANYGHLCGYVFLPKNHPWYGKDWYEISKECGCHGGISYAEPITDMFRFIEGLKIQADFWVIGFDCMHLGDKTPNPKMNPNGTYRTIEYVKKELENICKQAWAASLQMKQVER